MFGLEHLNHARESPFCTLTLMHMGCANISLYEFDSKYNLIHDLMDPDQPKQQIDVVYPILIDLITK